MQMEALINKLNWFYSLELSQVDLYNAQSKRYRHSYPGLVFERIAYIEQQHVDNIAGKIKDLGGDPLVLGDLVAPLFGKISGTIFSGIGLEHNLEINILLENKAMKDYRDLIATVKKTGPQDNELVQILQSNFVDEDLHTSWFAALLNKNSK